MKIKIFIKNTAMLVFTSVLLRTAGIIFRVYLAGKIGSEGMGLYQLIVSVYIFAAAFATSGISTAVTRLIAENESGGYLAVKKIISRAVILTLAVGLVSSCVIFFGAEFIARYMLHDTRAALSLKVLSFSLIPMGMSSVARGYFLAKRKTLEPSLTQIAEQVIRITSIVLLFKRFSLLGTEYCTAAVLLGDTIAETASFIILWSLLLKHRKTLHKGIAIKSVTKNITRIALPITAGAYVSTALHAIENLLVPLRLALFYGVKERGLSLFGAVRGMALPVLFFPASFLTSLSTLLIPEMSSAAARGDKREIKRSVAASFRITLVLSIFASSVFLFLSDEIGFIIYGNLEVGFMIKMLAPIVPFMYLESVSAGMLKGLDQQISQFKLGLLDSVIRIVLIFITLPMHGIKAYLLVMIVSNCFTSFSNSRNLLKIAELKANLLNWIIKPVACALASGFLAKIIINIITNIYLKAVAFLILNLAMFFLMSLLFGIITKAEQEMIFFKIKPVSRRKPKPLKVCNQPPHSKGRLTPTKKQSF